MRRPPAFALAVLVLCTSLTAPAAAAKGRPAVTPEPQQTITRSDGFRLGRTVGLVRGKTADPEAERVVREILAKAGVRTVRATDGRDPRTRVTVWLGDDRVLRELRVRPVGGMAAEGYVLAAGQQAGRGHLALSGVDGDGTFYAAQTLGQLVSGDRVPGIEIRDWPVMRYRGSIEGFYGTPWTHTERLDHLDYLGAHRMNTYQYAPKDDPYHREKWRDPYPADKLAQLGELIERARSNKIDFTFALSPGLSICYTSDSDFQALIAKFEALYELGARAFNVPLDDIDYQTWHCAGDREKYGTGGGAAGRAQSELLNRVQREWIATKPDLSPVQLVPTEYYNLTDTPYKQALREQLDSAVVVHWTGVGVIPRTITATEAAEAKAVFGHDILIWDNYPVNDYIHGRLPLADYSGREPGIAEHLTGIISNPMNQAAVSKVALYSFAEFGWNPAAYDEEASWRRALAERAGGDPRTIAALEVFADLNTRDTTLHPESAPRLAASTQAFWQAWNSGDREEAVERFRPVVAGIEAAPEVIRAGVVDPAFAVEAKAWLDATALWGAALREALQLLSTVDDGDGAAAWSVRQRIGELIGQAKAIRDVRKPHDSTYPRIGDGVLDTFVADAGKVHDQWMGLTPRRAASSSMGTYSSFEPGLMVDGDESTWYYSNRAPGTGDEVRVDLGAVREIGAVAVLMTEPDAPNDYLHAGALEYSADGVGWTELSRGSTAEVRATAPAGTRARYVRYRATAPNPDYWLVVREFSVEVTDSSETVLTATGTPEPASGSRLQHAVDGDVSTSYRAGSSPVAGDALTVTLSSPRVLDRITVLQPGTAVAQAELELRTSAGWQRIGVASGPYTAVAAPAAPVDAIRLSWLPGTGAPQLAEVIPKLAVPGG